MYEKTNRTTDKLLSGVTKKLKKRTMIDIIIKCAIKKVMVLILIDDSYRRNS